MKPNQILRTGRYGLYFTMLSAIGAVLFLLQGQILPERTLVVLQAEQQAPKTLAVGASQTVISEATNTSQWPVANLATPLSTAQPATTVALALPMLSTSVPMTNVLVDATAVVRTPTVVPTVAAKPATLAVVGADGATLLTAPNGQAQQLLASGMALLLNGQSVDGQWLWVVTNDNMTGWIKAANVIAPNISVLPVLEQASKVAVAPTAEAETTPNSTWPMPTATALLVANTPTVIRLAIMQPSQTPSNIDRITAQVSHTVARLNVRSGPGTTYAVLTTAAADTSFVALARNANATWVQIELPKPAGFGWVSLSFIKLSVPVTTLPVSNKLSIAILANATLAPTASAPTGLLSATPASPSIVSQPPVQPAAPVGQPAGLNGKLVIQSQNGALYLYQLNTGAVRVLTSGMDPAISPDGGSIALARGDGIYVINADGSSEHKIFGGREGLRSPKWSPDGHWLVFSRSDGEYKCRDTGDVGICPSEAQLLGDLPSNLPPAERKKAANQLLAQYPRVSRDNWMIARISAIGTDYRDLPALNSALAPDWVNSGIVYQSNGGLQRTQDQPNAQTQRVYFDHNIADPDWQPGGGRIIFQSKQGSHWEIFAVNPDGTGLVGLTRPQTTLVKQLPSNVAPAWSPDGSAIVFLSNRERDGEAGRWRVWMMNADGSNARPLPLDLPINYSYTMEQAVDWGR